MRHYLFIEDNETEILLIIEVIWKDDALYVIKTMRKADTLSAYQDNDTKNYLFIKDNMERWDIICLSKIMKLKYYLFIKDNRRWNIICLSRQWSWILPFTGVIWKDETLSVYQK
jgi:hypothetical protein